MTAPDPALTPSIIRPPSGWPGLDLREVWRYRSLCLVLAQRLLKVRYRQTVIGIGWAVGQPLLLMVVFTVVFGVLVHVDVGGIPYAVFYFAGLSVWQVVSKVVMEGASSIVANTVLVQRVYFPRVYLPVAVSLATLVDLACQGVALSVLVLFFGLRPTEGLLFLPLFIAVAYATSIGVALFLGAINVEYRDVSILLPVLLQAWFFATPLIYPASYVPAEYLLLYYLNPIALSVEGVRWGFAGTAPPPPEAWLVSITVAVLTLVGGYLVFRRRQSTFADIL